MSPETLHVQLLEAHLTEQLALASAHLIAARGYAYTLSYALGQGPVERTEVYDRYSGCERHVRTLKRDESVGE